ncbi:hypothetical protein MMIC_P1194 [Mariprofundus micogutta]|uniref:Uncharacterized protein n=1 Tax=Mariprofundus micogutta TaxID=1921010 RepID=A0A1L8CMT8_9PROT|nr:hypothetical protein MMIC_P1194 [Mariprofundus micogutta]
MIAMKQYFDEERNNILKWISTHAHIIPTSDLEFMIGNIPTFEPGAEHERGVDHQD